MIIWSGWGILVALAPVIGLVAAQVVVGALFGQSAYERYSGIVAPPTLLASALAVWLLGRRLNGGDGRILADTVTGEHVRLRRRHSFFFVPMEYWAVVLTCAAGWVAITGAL